MRFLEEKLRKMTNSKDAFDKFINKQPFPVDMTVGEKDLTIWQAACKYQKEADAKICDDKANGIKPNPFSDAIRNQDD